MFRVAMFNWYTSSVHYIQPVYLRICIYLQIYVSEYYLLPRCMQSDARSSRIIFRSILPFLASRSNAYANSYDSLMLKNIATKFSWSFHRRRVCLMQFWQRLAMYENLGKESVATFFLFLSLGMRDEICYREREFYMRDVLVRNILAN